MNRPGHKLIASTSIALTLLPLAAATHAKDDDQNLAIENIVVTAQRTEQNIQSTPVSITAFSAEDIANLQIDNAKDLGQVAPNVLIKPVTGGSAGITPFIRGGSVTDGAIITSEPEVGIYIDDVYQPRTAASFIEALDIERIEVLRGPQGTLYGRNSSAGALKIISRKPSETFTLKNEAGVGTWNEFYDKLSFSGPLSDDGKLRGGFSGMYRDRDGGRQYNATQEKDVGEETFKGFQTDLYYEGDTYSARLKAFYTDYESDGLYASSLDPFQMTGSYQDYPYNSGSIDTVLSPFESSTSDEQMGTSLHLSTDINQSLTLTSVTSWTNLKDDWATGFSGGVPNSVLGIPGDGYLELFARSSESDQKSFTQEFQLSGDAFENYMSYVGGLYYFRESGTQEIYSEIFFGPGQTNFDITTESYAVFGQVNLNVTEKLGVILGGRYTEDNKSLDAVVAGEIVDRKDDFSKFTPKAAIEYQASDDMLLFASYTEGFKAGGYNGLASSAQALNSPFEPQEVSAYELGMKSDWWHNRLRLNIAGFFNEYSNLQTGLVTNDAIFVMENYDAEHKGIEIELSAQLTEELYVWANGVHQSSKYTGTSATGGAASTGSLLGNRMTHVFDSQYAVGFDYSVALGDGTLGFGANANHRGEFYSTLDNAEIGHVNARTLVDAYVSYAYDQWKFSLAGKNLTDEKYWFTGFGFSVVQPRFMADPMTWRLSASYEF